MKHILSFNLFESKQVGILYHYTSFINIYKILSKNILKASSKWDDVPVICCTRNQYFHFDSGYTVNTQGRLVLDGNMLSHRYKIYPYAQDTESDFEDGMEFKNSWKGDPRKIGRGLIEWEERIIGDIKNIDKYILEVNINPLIIKKGVDEVRWIEKMCIDKGIKFDSY